jgi:hypothetical protein
MVSMWIYLDFSMVVITNEPCLSFILRLMVIRPVCLGIKHLSGVYSRIFVTVRQLGVCWWEVLSQTRGRVCCLQLFLTLPSAVIFGSEFHGTRDHILLSQIWDFPFFMSLPMTCRATVEVFKPACTRDNETCVETGENYSCKCGIQPF